MRIRQSPKDLQIKRQLPDASLLVLSLNSTANEVCIGSDQLLTTCCRMYKVYYTHSKGEQ